MKGFVMNETKETVSRRHFILTGAGALGTIASTWFTGSAFGRTLKSPTPRQTLGPFFPDDGDPVHEVRENLDFRLPISEANDSDLTRIQGHAESARGQTVYIQGQVLNRRGDQLVPLPGAVLIMWNASASGRYNHRGDTETPRFQHPVTGEWIDREHDPHFQYWGRSITDAQGNYRFKTIVPGFYPVRIGNEGGEDRPSLGNGWYRPPHLHFMISAPGLPQLVTQLYFKGEHIAHNEFIQQLNARDGILRSERIPEKEQEGLIVEYRPDPSGTITDGLVGHYDFVLTL